jgi:hypothetical protein
MPKPRPADQKEEPGQRRDALLKQLLKSKPESREELREKVKVWREQERASSAKTEKLKLGVGGIRKRK